MDARIIIIAFCLSLISCSGDEASSSDANVEDLAAQSSLVYRSAVIDLAREIENNGDVSETYVSEAVNSAKSKLLKTARTVHGMGKANQGSYSRKYNELAYIGLDTLMIPIMHFKDSLKASDPMSVKALNIEALLGVSAYGDFEMLKRIAPSEYNSELSKTKR